jgi:hypothetical protein
MKTNKKVNKVTNQITVMNFNNTKHAVWNKRRRFGM